jgi:hypothetical protein
VNEAYTFQPSASDPDGDNLSFTWREGTRILGSGVTLQTSLPEGLHFIEVEAFDGTDRSTDAVLIDIGNVSPDAGIRSAGGEVDPGLVLLEGAGFDGLMRPLRYSWAQTGGPPVQLQNPTASTASYFVVERGQRTFTLQVFAGATPALPVSTTLTTRNLGGFPGWLPRLVVTPGSEQQLYPLGVDDTNADALTHRWSSGNGQLSSTELNPLLVVTNPGLVELRHTVDDGEISTEWVTEVVVVGSSDEVFARVPAVLGGSVGAPVTLDATHSFGLASRASRGARSRGCCRSRLGSWSRSRSRGSDTPLR